MPYGARTKMTVPAAFQTPSHMAQPANMAQRTAGPLARPAMQAPRGAMAQPASARPSPSLQTGGLGPVSSPAGGNTQSSTLPSGMSGKPASSSMNSPMGEGSSASSSFAQGGVVPGFDYGGSADTPTNPGWGGGSGWGAPRDGGGSTDSTDTPSHPGNTWGLNYDESSLPWLQKPEPGKLNGRTFDSSGYWSNGRFTTGALVEGATPIQSGADAFSIDASPAGSGGPGIFAAGHPGSFNNITDALEASEGIPYYAGGGVIPDGTDAGDMGDAGNLGAAPGQPDFDGAIAKAKASLQYGRQKSGLLSGQQSPGASQGFSPNRMQTTQELRQPIPKAQSIQANRGMSYDAGGDVPDQPDAQAPAPQQPQQQGGQSGGPSPAGYVMGSDAMPPDQAQAMEMRIDPQQSMDPSARKLLAIGGMQDQDSAWKMMQSQRQKFNSYRAFAQAAMKGAGQKPPDLGAATHAATQAYQNVPDGNSVTFQPHQSGGVAVSVKPLGKGGAGKSQGMARGGVVNGLDDGGDPADPLNEDNNPVTAPIQGQVPLPQARPAAAPQGGVPSAAPQGVIPTDNNPVGDSVSDGYAAGETNPGAAASALGGAAKAAIQKIISAADFNKYITTNAGSYDNTMDTGADKVIQSLPDFIAQFNKNNNANYSVGTNAMAGKPSGPGVSSGSPQPPAAAFPPAGSQSGGQQPDKPVEIGVGRDDVPPQLAKMARALFPSVDQTQQRLKYVSDEMNTMAEQQNKIDVAKNQRLYGNQATEQGRVDASKNNADARVQASQNYAGARVNAEAIKAQVAQATAAAKNPAEVARWGVVRSAMAAGLSDPSDLIKSLGLSTAPTAAPQAAPAAAAPKGNANSPEIRYDKAGRGWIQGPNGQVMPAPTT
jgi:hypothetical protein